MKIYSTENTLPILLTAIGNPTRIQILNECEDWRTIKELVKILKLSAPSIHIHVTKLVEADLLEVKKSGRRTKVYKRNYKEILICFADSNNETPI